MDVRITSRAFARGFDITTPVETFSARKVPLSPLGEIQISKSAGIQIARLARESLLSSIYSIILSGGGFYRFTRDKNARRTWICKGEGKLLRLSERKKRRFVLSDEEQEIAESSKSWLNSNFAIRVHDDADAKLVICISLALSQLEYQSAFIPM
jgi:uncharacterized protein YxjI